VDEGVILKGDAIGSLEALAFELGELPIRKADVGDISHRDIVEAQTNTNPLHRVILGFNVKISPDLIEEAKTGGVQVFTDKIVYRIVEDYQEWRNNKKKELEEERREEISHPGMMKFLPNCTFRVSKPAVIGVRVLAGEIRTGEKLIRDDGKRVGEIKSTQVEKETITRAIQGQEVAIAIDNATVGRHIKPEDILFIDIPEKMARKLLNHDLSPDERDVLDKLVKIKRQDNKLWGL
jgi:translation initiation factor 5B